MHAPKSKDEDLLWQKYFCALAYKATDYYLVIGKSKITSKEMLGLECIFNYGKVLFNDQGLSLAVASALREKNPNSTFDQKILEAEFGNGRFRQALNEIKHIEDM